MNAALLMTHKMLLLLGLVTGYENSCWRSRVVETLLDLSLSPSAISVIYTSDHIPVRYDNFLFMFNVIITNNADHSMHLVCTYWLVLCSFRSVCFWACRPLRRKETARQSNNPISLSKVQHCKNYLILTLSILVTLSIAILAVAWG